MFGWLEGSETSEFKLGRTDDDAAILVIDDDTSEQIQVFTVLLISG